MCHIRMPIMCSVQEKESSSAPKTFGSIARSERDRMP